jgi:hypothetical protein
MYSEGAYVEWKAMLLAIGLSAIPVIKICVRGYLLRRVIRTAIREIPAVMTEIDIQITDPLGPSAAVKARAAVDGSED